MKLKYTYKRTGEKFLLDSLIINDISKEYKEIIKCDPDIDYLAINKTKYFGEMFIVNLVDKKSSSISNHYISRTNLREASLKELTNFESPIILNINSKCEYIEKISDDKFNFIFEDYGKLITLEFDSSKTLAFFKNNNILYVYDKEELHQYSIHGVYCCSSEKHTIMSGCGILSETWNEKRSGIFIPLNKDHDLTYLNDYNNRVENKYDIIPYYIKTYFTYTFNDNDAIINTANNTINHPNKIYLDNLIPELSLSGKRSYIITNQFEDEEVCLLDIEIL